MNKLSKTRRTTALLACALAFRLALAQQTLTFDNYLQKMSPAINFGNTLEAIPTETSWGNPKPTDAYFKAVRAAGFRSIRIPVAYTQYLDKNQKIDPKWMVHVTEVVRMATRAGLYAMINIHWDGGWMQPTYAKRDAVSAKLAKLWTQIATNFRDFDGRLLFAGTNEVMVDGDYGPPKPEYAEVQNGYNQTFVSAVRATGGKNKTRWLVVQAFNTNIDSGVKFNATLPQDPAKGRLMFEVHYYDPYHFTINEKSNIWQWGAKASDPKATDTWGNEDYADGQFQKVKEAFVDKGVPVLLGEYAVGLKKKFPGMRPFQQDWVSYITRSAYRHGVVPMYWDVGYETGLFHRTTGAQQDPELIRILVEACK